MPAPLTDADAGLTAVREGTRLAEDFRPLIDRQGQTGGGGSPRPPQGAVTPRPNR